VCGFAGCNCHHQQQASKQASNDDDDDEEAKDDNEVQYIFVGFQTIACCLSWMNDGFNWPISRCHKSTHFMTLQGFSVCHSCEITARFIFASKEKHSRKAKKKRAREKKLIGSLKIALRLRNLAFEIIFQSRMMMMPITLCYTTTAIDKHSVLVIHFVSILCCRRRA